MASGSITFSIPRPPEEVFAYLADLERAPEWVPDLVSVTREGAGAETLELSVGTRFREVVRIGGKEMEGALEISEYDPPRCLAHAGQGGPSRFEARFLLEPEGEGTRVIHEYSVEIGGFMRMMAPVIKSWLQHTTERSVANLKKHFEG